MKSIQDEILLVIPYITSSQGNELELALTGWRKYCKSNLRIVVIGDSHPSIEGKAELIEMPKVEKVPGQYTPNIDVARKLDKIYELFHNEYDHFVLANDDEYPIHEFDWKFLTQVTYLQSNFVGNFSAPTNYWSHDMAKTRKALDDAKKPRVNYCNHHPFYFDMEKFHDLSVKYDLANNSMIRENLYYNYYEFKTSKNVNDIRYGFWETKGTKEAFRKAVGSNNIRFICNSVAGYSKELMELIKEYYEKNDTIIERKNDGTYQEGISICISAWKTKDYIEECLDSVANQTWFKDHDNWEILLGIDACEETLKKVKEIMSKYKNLRVFMMKENVGTYVTCNTIMKEAKYDWLLRFDSDDIMLPNMVETLLRQKDVNDYILCSCEDFPTKRTANADGQAFIRKEIFFKYGGYLNRRCGCDSEFKIRTNKYIRQTQINDILFKRRQHLDSLTSTKEYNHQSAYRDEVKRYINEISPAKPIIDLITFDFNYIIEDNIIITFTSWKKRIKNCTHIVDLMMTQTLRPAKIVLNLSTDEFPRKEEELPKELVDKQNDIFEIYWVKENTKAYKKVLPTLERFPNDIIISIDDDIDYPNIFVEKMYQRFCEIGKNCPVSAGGPQSKWKPSIYTQHGADTLFKKEFFGNYPQEIYDNVISKNKELFQYDDLIYTYSVLLNGKRYFHETSMNMSKIVKSSKENYKNALTSNITSDYIKKLGAQHKAIRDYIKLKYGKSYEDLFNAPIYVNITTWPKRDKYLPIMLDSIANQTLKPDKAILWLSEDEYDKNNIPLHIQECLKDGRLSEICWVKENTKGFKRYNALKEFPYAYNILLDDDFEYDKNFIKELYTTSLKYQDCITVHSGFKIEYNNGKVTLLNPERTPSHKNSFMAGLSCIPPYTCPQEAINDNKELLEYSKNCDESRIKPYLIKHDVKIHIIYPWSDSRYKKIDGSQKESLYNDNKKVLTNGIRNKEKNLFNSVKITHTEKLFKEIWPNIGIDDWKIIK